MTAEAHEALFTAIFDLVEGMTQRPIKFLYMHGEGKEAFVFDEHKGQAKGSFTKEGNWRDL